jgi:hypothetical protein
LLWLVVGVIDVTGILAVCWHFLVPDVITIVPGLPLLLAFLLLLSSLLLLAF